VFAFFSSILDFLDSDNIFDARMQVFNNRQMIADDGPNQRRETALCAKQSNADFSERARI
jgi:hypothetical protein